MANKYQNNQSNNKENKNNKNQDTYRNDSELSDKNSYMVYELNNTFDDKDKNVFDGKVISKTNNNNNFFNKDINKKLEK